MNDDVFTERLHLIVATRELLIVERQAPQTLAALLESQRDATWEPLPDFVLETMWKRADERDQNGYLWPAFYMVTRAPRVLIGGINFKSLPRAGEIEIGYDVAPAQWDLGYATEAVAALCERALTRGATRLCAGVDADNLASARVLRKNGFERAGFDGNGRTRYLKS